MHVVVHKLVLLLSLIVAALGSYADTAVLWWMVEYDDPADWYDKDNLVTVGDLPGATDLEARIRFDNGTDSGYLNFWMLDDDGKPFPDDNVGMDSFGLEIDGYADMTGKDATYSFAIELGNYNENAEWVAIVTSAPQSYTSLQNHIGSFNAEQEWAGGAGSAWQTSYAVPEPSGGMLMLLGGAFLALRRRRSAGS